MRIACALVFGAWATMFALAAHAQSNPSPPESAAVRRSTTGDESRVILDRLAGLRFIDAAAKLAKPSDLRSDVSVDGPVLLEAPAIEQKLRQFIGRPFTRATMSKITTTIAAWYRAHRHPFIDVTFPEQDISGGVVQVIITEFRLGHLRVHGNKWFSSRLIASYIEIQPGGEIDTDELDADVTALNQNPYRQVKVVAEKSDVAGATDLVLETQDRLPLHVFAGFNNGGFPALGRSTWSVGVDWGNAFWLGQDLSYVFTSSDDFWIRPGDASVSPGHATLAEHQLSYAIPLPWHDRLVIFGNDVEAEPRIGPYFSQIGISWQASLRYVISLPETAAYQQDFQLGYDFKRSNNNLAFGGFRVSQSSTEIDQFPIIYDATMDDRLGRTIVMDQIVFSPGGLTGRNNDAAFQPSPTQVGTPYAHASYLYADADLTRLTRLPYDAGWLFRLQSQLSTSNLLASEELGAGGVETVRGYDERIANGPLGILVSNEIRSPAYGVIDSLLGANTGDQLQADAFWDFGYVREKRFVAGAENDAALQSVGAGLHYDVGRFVDLRFEYGWQLRRAPGADQRGGEAYFSAVIGY